MRFYPNDQILVGLKEVCRRIRAEELNEIRQYFVMSNVPDLDDEEGILRRCVEEFDTELDIGGRPDAVIHRSESATLFNQAVFVLDRPRSRLAREYRRLVGKLIMHNPADRDGALRFLVAYCNEFKRETALARDLVGNVQLTPQGAWMRSLAREDYGPGFGANPLDQIARNFPADAEIEMHVKRCKEAASERKAALANWQRRQANPKVEPGMVT